jgi:hypothetical protein
MSFLQMARHSSPWYPFSYIHYGSVSLRMDDLLYPAIPHYIEEEDEYNGYRIPKNSVVVGNTWYVVFHFLVVNMEG